MFHSRREGKQAEEFLVELRAANRENHLPRDAAIDQLTNEIAELTEGGKISP